MILRIITTQSDGEKIRQMMMTYDGKSQQLAPAPSNMLSDFLLYWQRWPEGKGKVRGCRFEPTHESDIKLNEISILGTNNRFDLVVAQIWKQIHEQARYDLPEQVVVKIMKS